MRRIAVVNQKGGVGKTTTTANLGAVLATRGCSVLLVDLDPQGHLSLHFGVEVQDGQCSVYDVLTNGTSVAEALVQVNEGLALLPADIDLAGAEAELISIPGREVILREALQGLPSPFDVILMDCPPSLGILTVNALVASHEVVVPLQAQFFALQGISKLLNTVTLVHQRINPQLRVSGIVLCLHEAATRLSGEVVEDLQRFLQAEHGANVPWADARIYPTPIRRNIKLAEACSFGQSVFAYAPRSNGALDYAQLANDIFPETMFRGPVEGPLGQPNLSDTEPHPATPESNERPPVEVQRPETDIPNGRAVSAEQVPDDVEPSLPRSLAEHVRSFSASATSEWRPVPPLRAPSEADSTNADQPTAEPADASAQSSSQVTG